MYDMTVVGFRAFTSKKNGKDYFSISAQYEQRGYQGFKVEEILVLQDACESFTIGSVIRVFYNKNGYVSEVHCV